MPNKRQSTKNRHKQFDQDHEYPKRQYVSHEIPVKGDDSMPVSERFDGIDDRIQKHSERLHNLEQWDQQNHLRLKAIEAHDEVQEERIRSVERSYEKLEITILSENKDTRQFFQSNMDKLWDLTASKDANNLESAKLASELAIENTRSETDYKKAKSKHTSDILIKLIGAGGIIYLVIEKFL